MKIELKPIGIVKNNITAQTREEWDKVTSEVILNEELNGALSQIDEFSHLIIIYWMHKISPRQRSTMKVHPKNNQNLPLVGVLASRSPVRPNPIGITTVKLLQRHHNVLKVIGLDAIDGTPVLDIKPHIPRYDCPTEVKVPKWTTL